jgi:addiction module HigA family antidote
MIPSNRIPASPGEILDEEFLKPLGITQTALARHIGVPVRRINEIVRCRRAISPETAQLLAAALGTTAQFWMNAQASYELATHRIEVAFEPLVHAV